MKRATINDLEDINELMSLSEGIDCFDFVRATLLNKEVYWFSRDNCAIVYIPMNHGRYDIHIYSKPREGNKDLRNWCILTGKYMFDNTKATSLINFVKKDRRDLRFFMAAIGCKKVGTINDEIIYAATRDNKDNIIERVR